MLPRTESSSAAAAMSPARPSVAATSTVGTPLPGPSSSTAERKDSTTSTWPARTRAATTWTTSSPANRSRPEPQTRRVERRTSSHRRPTERRWLRLSIWRSSGSSGSDSSVIARPRGWSPQQPLGGEVGGEGGRVRLGRRAVDPVLRDERVGELLDGPLLGEQLGQVGAGDVRRQVDRARGVEDDQLVVDLLPGDALAPQLHV